MIKKLVLPLLAAVALVPACSTVNTVERATPTAQRDMVSDKRIITDAGLGRRVKIVGVNESEGPGGFLKVQVEVRNSTRSSQRFNYRVEWFDQAGMQISTPTGAYKPKEIEGGESLFISEMAPTQTAKDFRFKFVENP